MYVFVTVAELTGPAKQLSLGQVDEKITIKELMKRCRHEVDKQMPERDRDISRHFWFHDRLVTAERAYLADIATSVNVTLELRPDHYLVKLPGHGEERYAIDPELRVATTVDSLIGWQGAWQCYDLAPAGQAPLDPQTTMVEQKVLPFHARLSQQEAILVVKQKPQLAILVCAALVALVAIGLACGYLLAMLLKGA
jgi:hypothetical protein